ncbi:MAG: DUF4364 family protein [Clostridiales bacterium]|nr:DUF4364 family protein [Clostridiales bacterium]
MNPIPKERGETEDRLILLSALSALGTATEDQLLRFSVEAELFPQFRFLLLLGDLQEESLIAARESAEGRLFFLSPEGRETLRLFGSEIRPSVRERIALEAPARRRKYRDERQLPADWEKTEDGFAVTLRALEEGREMLSVRLFAATRVDAQRWCLRWPEAAQEIYGTLIRALSEEAGEE